MREEGREEGREPPEPPMFPLLSLSWLALEAKMSSRPELERERLFCFVLGEIVWVGGFR